MFERMSLEKLLFQQIWVYFVRKSYTLCSFTSLVMMHRRHYDIIMDKNTAETLLRCSSLMRRFALFERQINTEGGAENTPLNKWGDRRIPIRWEQLLSSEANCLFTLECNYLF